MTEEVKHQLSILSDVTQPENARASAAKYLASRQVSACYNQLCMLLNSESRMLRQAGIISLRLLGDKRAIAILDTITKRDKNRYIQGLAREAIRALGGTPTPEREESLSAGNNSLDDNFLSGHNETDRKSSKNGLIPHHDECINHPGRPAVIICEGCARPLCKDCVGLIARMMGKAKCKDCDVLLEQIQKFQKILGKPKQQSNTLKQTWEYIRLVTREASALQKDPVQVPGDNNKDISEVRKKIQSFISTFQQAVDVDVEQPSSLEPFDKITQSLISKFRQSIDIEVEQPSSVEPFDKKIHNLAGCLDQLEDQTSHSKLKELALEVMIGSDRISENDLIDIREKCIKLIGCNTGDIPGEVIEIISQIGSVDCVGPLLKAVVQGSIHQSAKLMEAISEIADNVQDKTSLLPYIDQLVDLVADNDEEVANAAVQILSKLPDPRIIPALERAAQEKGIVGVTAGYALEALGPMTYLLDKKALDDLLKKVATPGKDRKEKIMSLERVIEVTEASETLSKFIEPVTRALGDKTFEVVVHAVDAALKLVKKFPDERFAKAVLSAVVYHDYEFEEAEDILVAVGEPAVGLLLAEMSKEEPDQNVYDIGNHVLPRLSDKALPHLMKALKSDASTGKIAVHQLGKIGGPSAIKRLVELLADLTQPEDVWGEAALGLIEIGKPAAEAAKQLLNSTEPETRCRAEGILRRIDEGFRKTLGKRESPVKTMVPYFVKQKVTRSTPWSSNNSDHDKSFSVLWTATLWEKEAPGSSRIAVSSTGDHLVAASSHRDIFFFHRQKGLLWREFTNESVFQLATSPKLTHIAAASYDHVFLLDNSGIRVWSHQLKEDNFLPNSVTALDIESDGSTVAVGSMDKRLILIDPGGTILWQYQLPVEPKAIKFHPEGNYLAVTVGNWLSSDKFMIFFFDRMGEKMWSKELPGNITAIDFIRSSGNLVLGVRAGDSTSTAVTMLFCLDQTGSVIWNYNLGDNFNPLINTTSENIVVALGKNLAVLTVTGNVLWKRRLPGISSNITSLAVAEKGNIITVLDGYNNLYIFNSKGIFRKNYFLPRGGLYSDISISRDGRYLSVGTICDEKETIYFFKIKS
jgi:HEAT repeat protein/outer membrane protein assembly factor BamB